MILLLSVTDWWQTTWKMQCKCKWFHGCPAALSLSGLLTDQVEKVCQYFRFPPITGAPSVPSLSCCSCVTWRWWPGRAVPLPVLFPRRPTYFLCVVNRAWHEENHESGAGWCHLFYSTVNSYLYLIKLIRQNVILLHIMGCIYQL